jgi:hypothetical protein
MLAEKAPSLDVGSVLGEQEQARRSKEVVTLNVLGSVLGE